jgi:hypothetical protein
MFGTIGIFAFAVAALFVVVHYLACARRRRATAHGARLNLWEQLLHLVLVASFGVLATTGVSVAWLAWALDGPLLLLHVAAGGVFAVALAAMALTWAESHAGGPRDTRFDGLQMVTFWLMMLAGLIAMLSMVVSMTAWFGTDEMNVLSSVHRYAGLEMTVLVGVHLYATAVGPARGWSGLWRRARGEQRETLVGVVSSEEQK